MSRLVLRTLLVLAVLAAGMGNSQAAWPLTPAAWETKVAQPLQESLAERPDEPVVFIIHMSEQADLSGAARLHTKAEKGAYVVAQLKDAAGRTQPALLAELQAAGVEHRAFWVANFIWARGDAALVAALARRDDVAGLYANPQIAFDEPEPAAGLLSAAALAVEWNIQKVNAPAVWAEGFSGQGVVIAGQDTGYDWDHPALINQYRGWNGSAADHNYNWWDAIHTVGSICGADSPQPCDDYSHGTHTMGTMVGDDGAANQIGMAPGAQWIGCRNMDRGVGTPATYLECFEWFLAPEDLSGQNPRPDLAPDIINNSWGCPPSEGCDGVNEALMPVVIDNLRAAGILVVASAGNSGSSCGSVQDPPAIYAGAFTVGNVDKYDLIHSSSSRGPVMVDGSGRMKPDISAPGTSVRSSVPGGYTTMNGTSMAGPHVAGLAALLISANPGLRGQVALIETLIEQSAVPLTTTESCGGVSGASVPNNTYGWGRIDAWQAYLRAASPESLLLSGTVSPQQVAPGGLVTFTLTLSHAPGILPISQAVLTGTLPLEAAVVSATAGYQQIGSSLEWDFASLGVGESQQVQIVARLPLTASGTVSLTAEAGSAGTAPAAPLSLPAEIVPFDVELEKSASSPAVVAGRALTYTLRVTNTHPTAPLHNLVLTDTLPSGSGLLSATQPFSLAGATLTWTLPELAPGGLWQVNLAVSVPLTTTQAVLVNQFYGLQALELLDPAGGPPVSVTALHLAVYLPLLVR